MKWPIALDLFSGPGGMTLGLRRSRFRVIGAVEKDLLACETYRVNHAKRIRLWEQDIALLDPKKIRSELSLVAGELDLLAACPPCQGFSSTRTLNGSRRVFDPRNSLVLTVANWVSVFRPKAVLFENVPGLLPQPEFGSFSRSLKAMGYSVNQELVDASDVGVPQRRKRLVVVATLTRLSLAPGVRSTPSTVRAAIGHLPVPGKSGDPLHDFPENRSDRIQRLIEAIPKDGGSRREAPAELLPPCHSRTNGFSDVYGRMAWDQPSPTITGGCSNPSKGRFLHPEQNRSISLREAALLQGFPADYHFSLRRGKEGAAAMIGNAVPPDLVVSHALQIRRHLRSEL